MFTDVAERTEEEEEGVDLDIFTPPCQPYSKSGKGDGISDPRGKVIAVGVKHIVKWLPRVAIMENVKALI
eukprot:2109101-Karenia_brevis.AAC.1